MFDIEKMMWKLYLFFVIIFICALCLWGAVKLIELVFWQLMIGIGVLAVIALIVWILLLRYRRW